MPKFFKEHFADEPYITGDDAVHIAKSLRMRVGEALTVSDTRGTDYECVITSVSPERVELTALTSHANVTEPTIEITLFQCMPKSDKMDSVVRQSVELGASSVVPVISSRCVSLPDKKSADKKAARWQKIADEAAGQSGRGILPRVHSQISYTEMLKCLDEFELALMFYELGGVSIRTALSNCSEAKKIAVIIGPEGGFSKEEAEHAASSGAVICTLGKRIFRTETAPLAAISAIMTLTENMT